MKQTLQLKLGQSLTMTPQLQQAIRLLQLSSLELQAEIQEILESNPLLEITEDNNNDGGDNASGENAASSDNSDKAVNENRTDSNNADEINDNQLSAEAGERDVDNRSEDIPDDLPVDSSWEDTYDSYQPSRASSDDPDQRNYEQPASIGESLAHHLEWQLLLTPFSETDQAIATAIIDSIDHNGYLATSLEDICDSLNENSDAEEDKVELDEVESVLKRIQNFDPPGVGARDIRECMQLQLNVCDPATPWLAEAKTVVNDYFDLLANRDYTLIMRRMRISEEQLQQIIMLIQSLNPRPGSQITDSQPEYIIPDVFVRKVKGIWRVELNPEVTPRLSINSLYAGMAQGSNNSSSDTSFLKNHLQEARWFLKSLKSRNETLLKVAKCIVERQRAFLEYGDEAMKPLVMHDVAEVVDMHESTISRVTTKKYMHTPRGIYELKYFFSSHVSTANGGECSATAIRAMLKKLIAAEEASKPLSDNKLASLLAKQGINVARRTVAKYREAMAIPPSNERKRLM
ncbi:MAG: RNA polymerase sigma-54 factor [Gammaproteobacteria bacterium SG8_15]|nr:MAG: RNA polymerase sigma-54 factor [Gammaproteobacteria bacterium SG8_15]